jgi:hypothetical protein
MTQNEMVKNWLKMLLLTHNKVNANELTADEIKNEISEVKETIKNEHLWALGTFDNFHEANIYYLEEYIEVLYSLLAEKEVKHEIMG